MKPFEMANFSGFSVITMFEVFVLFIDLGTLYCRKRKIKKEQRKDKKRLMAQLLQKEACPQLDPAKQDPLKEDSSSQDSNTSVKSNRENNNKHEITDALNQ